MNTNYTFREIAGLTKFVRVLLGLGVAIAVVSLLSNTMQAELLSRGSYSEAEAQANDSRQQIIALLSVALYFLTVVVFGCWIVRANKNVRALGAEGLRMTPGWAVGYFFVPILHVWKPYQAMKDLWRASHNPTEWHSAGAGSVLRAWWTLWILSIVLGWISFRLMMDASGVESLRGATYVLMVYEAVYVPLCLVAMALVAQIARAQNTRVEEST